MIKNANKEIEGLLREAEQRRGRRQRLTGIVRTIDDLLWELEDLNLQGVERIPATLRERVGAVLRTVPAQEGYEDLRVRFRVVPMMDVLFRAQEVLFLLKDPARSLYWDGEGDD